MRDFYEYMQSAHLQENVEQLLAKILSRYDKEFRDLIKKILKQNMVEGELRGDLLQLYRLMKNNSGAPPLGNKLKEPEVVVRPEADGGKTW